LVVIAPIKSNLERANEHQSLTANESENIIIIIIIIIIIHKIRCMCAYALRQIPTIIAVIKFCILNSAIGRSAIDYPRCFLRAAAVYRFV
jgi:hypothetical protein